MLGDTIVALASAPGASARAVLRLSGPAARAAAAAVFAPALPAARLAVPGAVQVRGHALPALALGFPAPHSYTGEDVVELHVPGSPLLVQCLLDALLQALPAGQLRRARPGEFTARACLHGRLDAAAVEGLLLLLHAGAAREAAAALPWLRGGLGAGVQQLRAGLQDALALLEAGLDFTADETGAVAAAEWQAPLPALAAALDERLAALPAAVQGGDVLLLGRANAGKSSLANALAGRPVALVADQPGTTRDVLRVPLPDGGVLWDAPGDLDQPAAWDAAALQLRDRLAGSAAAALWVLDATAPAAPAADLPLPLAMVVWTKADAGAALPPLPPAVAAAAAAAGAPVLATSARTGQGLPALRAALAAIAQRSAVDAGGPLRAALQAAAAAVARARAVPAAAPELAAAELQAALRALDEFGGSADRHGAEALLDRIYGRFCLGK